MVSAFILRKSIRTDQRSAGTQYWETLQPASRAFRTLYFRADSMRFILYRGTNSRHMTDTWLELCGL